MYMSRRPNRQVVCSDEAENVTYAISLDEQIQLDDYYLSSHHVSSGSALSDRNTHIR